jgi:hypothetical protein
VFAIARTVDALDAVRISVGFFTTDDEVSGSPRRSPCWPTHAGDHPAVAR